MRKINRIVLHCTGGPVNQSVSSIENHWYKILGWKNAGYHFLIEQDGTIHNLQPIEKPSNGVRGFNADSIHISTVGGAFIDDRSLQQKTKTIHLIKSLRQQFGHIPVVGHRDLSPDRNGDGKITKDEWLKQCPSFDVSDFLKANGL